VKWKGWDRVRIRVASGEEVEAIAPLIISASRSTDIPAFYGDWFMDRLAKGYVRWKSPFSGKSLFVSFAQARVFVFWSKNPAPFLPHLDILDRQGYHYYFQFTLNGYDQEGLEPHMPPLEDRIATFARLAGRIGKCRVVWQYDPLLLSDRITVSDLLDRIRCIGDQVHPYTGRLVISFIDIAKYPKVQRNLNAQGFSGVREFTEEEVISLAEGLRRLNERWGLIVTACGERRDLSASGIGRGQCINYSLMAEEFRGDPALMAFLRPEGQQAIDGNNRPLLPGRRLKDPGQRNQCGCIVSKDIGQYNTCPHLCAYCYANSSATGVRRNYAEYLADAQKGRFNDAIIRN
jgi:hypothetical protein